MELDIENGKSGQKSEKNLSEFEKGEYEVMSEIPINGTDLHKIATGESVTVGFPGELFAIRFLLKDSFKSGKSNFVVNNFLMQVLAVGKDNAMRKEHIASKVRVQTVEKEVERKESEKELQFRKKTAQKELF